MEIAHALAQTQPPPKRSILFLAVTAEEKGLLGAKYYAAHPLYPLDHTLADINLDVINLWGPTSDLISIGMGNSTLDDLLVEIAREHGRTMRPTPIPRKATIFVPTTSNSPSKGCPHSIPRGAGNTSASPRITARKNKMNTPPRTTTKSAMKLSLTGT